MEGSFARKKIGKIKGWGFANVCWNAEDKTFGFTVYIYICLKDQSQEINFYFII